MFDSGRESHQVQDTVQARSERVYALVEVHRPRAVDDLGRRGVHLQVVVLVLVQAEVRSRQVGLEERHTLR